MILKNRKCAVMEFVEIKGIVVATFSWAFATLALDGELLGILLFLLIIDSITGYIKAIIFKKATSHMLIYGIGKKLTILLIPIAASAGAIIAGKDITGLIAWVYSLLALGEVYSIIGNVIAINTKKEISEFNALMIIANRLEEIANRKKDEK